MTDQHQPAFHSTTVHPCPLVSRPTQSQATVQVGSRHSLSDFAVELEITQGSTAQACKRAGQLQHDHGNLRRPAMTVRLRAARPAPWCDIIVPEQAITASWQLLNSFCCWPATELTDQADARHQRWQFTVAKHTRTHACHAVMAAPWADQGCNAPVWQPLKVECQLDTPHHGDHKVGSVVPIRASI
jgi:hypothetical protein